MLQAAAHLHVDKLPPEATWRVAFDLNFTPSEDFLYLRELYDYSFPRSVTDAWNKVDKRLNQWTALAKVRPFIERNAGRATITLAGVGSGVFGALAVQLFLAATKTEGFAMCSACGLPYFPSRRPRRGQRNYCARCANDGASRRVASVDYRLREKARKLRSHGLSDEEVARKVNLDVETVHGLPSRPKRPRR